MFTMFATLFSMLTNFFEAGNKGALALNNVADVAVDTSIAYREERRIKMAHQLKTLEADPTSES